LKNTLDYYNGKLLPCTGTPVAVALTPPLSLSQVQITVHIGSQEHLLFSAHYPRLPTHFLQHWFFYNACRLLIAAESNAQLLALVQRLPCPSMRERERGGARESKEVCGEEQKLDLSE
jgi:hypothetical protein